MTPLQKGMATTLALSGLALVVAVTGNPFAGPFGGPNGGSQGGGGATASAPTFTSTQADGGAAFVVPVSQRICLNGGGCGIYVQYDGGSIGFVGAEVDVPSGFTDSQKVNADVDITPHAVIAQAASGERAFGPAHDGARIYFGESGNVYCYNSAGEVRCASAWAIQSLSVDTIGSYTSNRVIDIFNPHVFPTGTLGTCNGGSGGGNIPEGTIKVQSGSSLSAQSRVCACVSDGAGTPAYTWVNLGCPNTAGTNSTCPACP